MHTYKCIRTCSIQRIMSYGTSTMSSIVRRARCPDGRFSQLAVFGRTLTIDEFY